MGAVILAATNDFSVCASVPCRAACRVACCDASGLLPTMASKQGEITFPSKGRITFCVAPGHLSIPVVRNQPRERLEARRLEALMMAGLA